MYFHQALLSHHGVMTLPFFDSVTSSFPSTFRMLRDASRVTHPTTSHTVLLSFIFVNHVIRDAFLFPLNSILLTFSVPQLPPYPSFLVTTLPLIGLVFFYQFYDFYIDFCLLFGSKRTTFPPSIAFANCLVFFPFCGTLLDPLTFIQSILFVLLFISSSSRSQVLLLGSPPPFQSESKLHHHDHDQP